ncbi:esterase/lipase family protein [Pseudomonas sp. Hp2]|uniref:esterase/lipase family protein n=1 Tax=Pseudomonas sp. Hp2 TaxID=701189 RepID=UPI001C49BFA4|nr:alpha/beta hydrolase [Pseudomonas sp. Hp2]
MRFQAMVRALALAALLAASGCAMVTVKSRGAGDYVAITRGDVLTTDRLSESGIETLRVAGIEPKPCRDDPAACAARLDEVSGLGDERRLATQAELWIAEAIARNGRQPAKSMDDATLHAWLEAARHAYAYLFFTARTPGERAFENRQTQVRDYYNYAVQQVVGEAFRRWRSTPQPQSSESLDIDGWRFNTDLSGFRLPGDTEVPEALFDANSLRFEGLRSTYRRDGFGAELVAKVPPSVVGDPTASPVDPAAGGDQDQGRGRNGEPDFSEMPYAPTTALLRFHGATLQELLATREVTLVPYDPYRNAEVVLHGQHVPLAANFTAAYGLWLAQSGFASQSLRSMLGRKRGIDRPHLYLMQPYDPDRRILLLLHGLASSPEAWVNVANEIMGDEALRQHYQIWQVYYPTNAPIPYNRAQIEALVQRTLKHFDPGGSAAASQHMVLIGHSMGGVIGRLLVSSSGEALWQSLMADRRLDGERGRRIRERLSPLLHFEPLPEVDRAIFIAAPHRGTPMAEGKLGRLVGRLIRLPVTLLQRFGDVLQDLAGQDGKGDNVVPTGIDNLRDTDPFILASENLPISPRVRYHTIVGKDDDLPLQDSSDGVVPYRSAHLDGAESEKVIPSWHSVQETPQAVLEIRRILREQMRTEAEGAR